MDKTTGEVYWTDKSPGTNILHGQWSSPTVAHLGGVDQVIFAGGDGWVYSFKADKGQDGKPELLWKFDANPKTSKWILGGRGTRNNIIATPVVCDGLVYVAVGQDPEHGEGEGHVWCLDPTKRGDVSPQLAMKVEGDKRVPIAHRRLQAVVEEDGEIAVDNDNSAVVWHYSQFDQNGDGEFDFEEEMHRSCGTVAIQDDLLYIADFSGLFHCLDAKSGKVHWTYDMLAAAWGSPLIVEGHVYIGDEDGDISIFALSADPKVAMKEVDAELVPINYDEEEGAVVNMGNSVYSTPIVANDVLFIADRSHIFAIKAPQGAE
jgi:outer membrane protein assembly factor BamB